LSVKLIIGDCREKLKDLPPDSVHCCVTSPPYFGLRDYGVDGQIGLEKTPDAFVAELVAVFREVKRVLRDDGSLWLNLGDSYAGSWGNYGGQNRGAGKQRAVVAGSRVPNEAWDERTKFLPPAARGFPGVKPKDLIGIPWLVAFVLRSDGWWLRQDIIWSKPNPMPESVRDRCTKAHEYIFMLTKSAKYYYDADAIAEDAKTQNGQCGEIRNKRSVWTVATHPFAEAHFATFPPELIEPCILAGCPEGGTVLDPFSGAGTTGMVADRLKRNAILIELNPEYAKIADNRMRDDAGMFAQVETN
jgi:DNA modification methylase